jgi:hypothetical protein
MMMYLCYHCKDTGFEPSNPVPPGGGGGVLTLCSDYADLQPYPGQRCTVCMRKMKEGVK